MPSLLSFRLEAKQILNTHFGISALIVLLDVYANF